jgi:hypothetical protein
MTTPNQPRIGDLESGQIEHGQHGQSPSIAAPGLSDKHRQVANAINDHAEPVGGLEASRENNHASDISRLTGFFRRREVQPGQDSAPALEPTDPTSAVTHKSKPTSLSAMEKRTTWDDYQASTLRLFKGPVPVEDVFQHYGSGATILIRIFLRSIYLFCLVFSSIPLPLLPFFMVLAWIAVAIYRAVYRTPGNDLSSHRIVLKLPQTFWVRSRL